MRFAFLSLPFLALPLGYLLTSQLKPTPPGSVAVSTIDETVSTPTAPPEWTPQAGRGRSRVVTDEQGASLAPSSVRRTANRPQVRATTPPPSSTDSLASGLFTRLDADHSGRLELAEMPTALREAFARWDANGDGSIDRAEFQNYFRQRTKELRGSAVFIATTDLSSAALPSWFVALDPNREGQIPLSRWRESGRPLELFRFLDRNGDGVITRQEAMAFAVAETGRAGGVSPLLAAQSQSIGETNRGLTSPTHLDSSHAARPARGAVTVSMTPSPDSLEVHYLSLSTGGPVANLQAKHTAAAAAPKPAPKPAARPATAIVLPAAPAPAPDPAPPPPAPDREYATLPAPLTNQSDYWTLRNDQNVALLEAGGKPDVLFLGDSITDLLATGAGKDVWQKYYLPLGSADFAVGGARTSQVLWQIETGQVAAANPKVIVLLIGTNNLGMGQNPEEVAAGIARIVDELRTQLPKTRILLLGLLPRGQSVLDPFRAPIAEVNALIADLNDGDWVTYLDIDSGFLQPDGSLSPFVMGDFVHPTSIGYNIYTVGIWDTLMRLLNAN